jgi:hypothetical protein
LTSSPPSSGLSPAVPPECPTLLAGNWRRGLRSLRDLTQHLTTRADDSHAAPVRRAPRGEGVSPHRSRPCQGLVRFCALLRIKPHAPPLVRAPVNSFEFQPCGRTPQAARLPRWLRHRGPRGPDTQRASFTAWTTRVSNPVCSPRCRASASVTDQLAAFATGVLPNIYEFHLYTGNSASLFRPLAHPSQAQSPG